MNTNYIEILRCVIGQTKPSQELTESISLTELYNFSCLNKLVSPVVNLVTSWKISSEEEGQLVQYWKSEAASLVFFEYRKLALIKRVLELAKERDISLTFFKGYSIARLYSDFALRNSSDTDILVESAQLDKVCSMLEEIGYFHEADVDTENVYTYIYNEAGIPLHKLEIHTSLYEDLHGVQLELFESLELSSAEKNIHEDICGISFWTLNHTEHLIYQIFHMVKHITCHGFPARYLIDTALFIKAHVDSIDWDKMNVVTEMLGYSQFCRQLFSILITYFEVPACIMCDKKLCDPVEFEELLHDILSFGARSYSEELSHYFYFFENYIERLEERSGNLLEVINFDGTTVPIRLVPLKYQEDKSLQKRIYMLRKLWLI